MLHRFRFLFSFSFHSFCVSFYFWYSNGRYRPTFGNSFTCASTWNTHFYIVSNNITYPMRVPTYLRPVFAIRAFYKELNQSLVCFCLHIIIINITLSGKLEESKYLTWFGEDIDGSCVTPSHGSVLMSKSVCVCGYGMISSMFQRQLFACLFVEIFNDNSQHVTMPACDIHRRRTSRAPQLVENDMNNNNKLAVPL